MKKIEIGTCGDCEWYDKDAPMLENMCMNSELWNIIGVEYASSIWLVPDENFGCIHWEEKDDGN